MRNEKGIGGLTLAAALGVHAVTAHAQVPDTANRDLEEIVVYGTQVGTQATTGSRLNLTVAETPATIDVIDGNAIRARIDTSVIDAVTRSAGFTAEADPGNGHSSIAARGFRGQGSVTKLYDGTNYYTAAGTITFPFDTWGIERVEVLKGPSSVLYGEGGIGGAINIIPKIPQYQRSADVRLMMGQDDTRFAGIDLTGGLTDSVAYRFNFSKNESDNWVRAGESDAQMVSLALRWDVNADLTLTARYDGGEQEPMKYFGVPIANGDFIDDFLGSNFNVGDAQVRYDDESFRLKADWTVSDSMSLHSEVYRLTTDRFWHNSEFYSFDDQTGLVERFDPLVLKHEMEHEGIRSSMLFSWADNVDSSVGFEFNDISFARPTNLGPGNPDRVDFDTDFDVVDPYNFDPGTLLSLTDAVLRPDDQSDTRQWALFGESRIELSEQLALVAALRYEKVDTDYRRLGRDPIDQSVDALTGRLGAVFDLDENTALYAQYGTGATHPSNSVVTASASNRNADMIESEQIEIGIKRNSADGKLQWSLALFDIVKNNLIEDDPDSGNPDDLIIIPEQTSRGVEVGFSYGVSDTVQVHGNASWLDAETDTGETPNYVPEETLNLGIAWSATRQFRMIADARYVGERFHSTEPIPSYIVVDASGRWSFNDNLALTLKAENLFDEIYASTSYYSTTWLVGKPRTLSLVADYRFR